MKIVVLKLEEEKYSIAPCIDKLEVRRIYVLKWPKRPKTDLFYVQDSLRCRCR